MLNPNESQIQLLQDGLNVLKNLQPYTPRLSEIDELLNKLIRYERPVEKVYYFYSAQGINGDNFVYCSNILQYSFSIDALELYREIYNLLESEEPEYKWTIVTFSKL